MIKEVGILKAFNQQLQIAECVGVSRCVIRQLRKRIRKIGSLLVQHPGIQRFKNVISAD